MRIVELGRTGLRVSRLCFGTGTEGYAGRSRQTRLGLDGLIGQLCRAQADLATGARHSDREMSETAGLIL